MSVPATEEYSAPAKSFFSELFDRERFLLVVAIFFVELGIFAAGILTPLTPATQQSLANQTSNEFGVAKNLTPPQLIFFIFAHNLLLAVGDMVPVGGALLFAFSIYGTGLAAQAIVVSNSGLPPQFGLLLLAFPYSLVELSSYAIAVVAGVMLIVSLVQRRFRRELKVFALEGIVVTVLLILAAAMETATGLWPVVGLALWLPTGLILAGIIIMAKRNWT